VDAVRIQRVDSPKTYTFPMPSQVQTITDSQDRQVRVIPLLASVIFDKCVGCGVCIKTCPTGAIILNRVASIDASRCTGCGQCVAECPQEALVLKRA